MRSFLFFLLMSSAGAVCGQMAFSRYFQENTLPSIENDSYLNMKFAWNLPGKIQASMNNGLTELEEGNVNVAIGDFEEVIRLSPSFLPAHYYLGVSYKKKWDFEHAEITFLQALNINPKSSEVLIMLGEVYQQQSKYEKARDAYEKGIGADARQARGYYDLGMLEIVQYNQRKALKYFEKCTEVDAAYANAYLIQGLLRLSDVKKKNKEAFQYFNRALQMDSTHREALFWRGLAYVYIEEPQKGIEDWNKLILYNPGDPFFLMMRGFLNIELDDFDHAYNDLRKAILANPENEEHFRRGETIMDKRIDLQYATSYAVRFSYGLEEEALHHFKKGFCYLLSDKMPKAIESFKASASIQPSATAYFLEALTFEYQKKHDSAYRYYDKALALDNDIIDAHKKRALYRYAINDWKGAYADLNEMSRLQPDLMVTYRLRGLIKASQKDYYGAIIDFAKYLKSDTTDYEIWLQRGNCRSIVNDKKGANEDFLEALKYDRLNGKVYELVTENYLSLLDTTSALLALKQYASALPEGTFPTYWQAEIYMHQKKWDSARVMIEKTIRRFHPVYYSKIEYSKAVTIKGIVLLNLLQFAPAITEFNRALELNSANMEALYHRGKTYIKAGDNKRAISDFKKLKSAGYGDSEAILQSLTR